MTNITKKIRFTEHGEIEKTLSEWMYKENVYLSGEYKSEYYVKDLAVILSRFLVSKEKIKRVLQENRFPKPRTDYESANNDTISGLLKSLGLGD